MIRATFNLALAGDQTDVEQAVNQIGDQLSERGFFIDEDFEILYGAEWKVSGLRINTLTAMKAVLEVGMEGLYMIETPTGDEPVAR